MVSFLIAVVALAVFLVLPGTLLMLALGLRPLPAAALGAPATVGILAVAAQILSCLHVPWNLATAVVSGLLLGIILLLGLRWRHIFRREVLASLYSKVRNGEQGQTWFHRPESSASNQSAAPRWIFLPSMLGAFLMAGFFQLWPFLSQLGDYSAPAQLFDSMFHYSGIRYIADTGDAGWIGSLDGVYGSNFHHVYYPNQWHLLAALFVPWASVTLIANALFFALVAVCFPLGVALLAEYAWGRHSGAIPLAVLLSPATLVFPYYIGLLQNLYPYVLATIWWLPLAWVVLKLSLIHISEPTARYQLVSSSERCALRRKPCRDNTVAAANPTSSKPKVRAQPSHLRLNLPVTAKLKQLRKTSMDTKPNMEGWACNAARNTRHDTAIFPGCLQVF